MRPRWQDDVRILGLMRHSSAGSTAHDAADDRALLVAAEHTPEDRASDSSRSHLRRVSRGNAAALVTRLERVDRSLDRVRTAAYRDAPTPQRQGPRVAGSGRRFAVGDVAVDGR